VSPEAKHNVECVHVRKTDAFRSAEREMLLQNENNIVVHSLALQEHKSDQLEALQEHKSDQLEALHEDKADKPQEKQVLVVEEKKEVHTPLRIMLVSARGLRKSDWLPDDSVTECFCSIRLNGQEIFNTKTAITTLDPMWNIEAEIDHYVLGATLEFSIYDQCPNGGTRHSLGTASLDSEVFNPNGLNGEIEVKKSEGGIGFLWLQVKQKGKEYPHGPSSQLSMTIERSSVNVSWGAKVNGQDGVTLVVDALDHGGHIGSLNNLRAPEERLLASDYILSVNCVSGTSLDLAAEFIESTKVDLVVRRGRETTVLINRGDMGKSLGLGLATPIGNSLVITGILPGILQEYNSKTTFECQKLKAGHRIVAVDGRRGNAVELGKLLAEVKGKFKLTVLHCMPVQQVMQTIPP